MSKRGLSVNPAEYELLTGSKLHLELTKIKRNKYGNSKVEIDGIKFDSISEGKRYQDLKYLELAGKINGLKLQEKIVIIGDWISDKKLNRGYSYYCDFSYYDERGVKIIEDVKSSSTAKNRTYINKRKHILAKIQAEKLNWEFKEIINYRSKRGKR